MVDADLALRVFMTGELRRRCMSLGPFSLVQSLAGISAVGLEAMATAFNITIDLSQTPAFNAAVGFTRADTLRAITECVGYAPGSPGELCHPCDANAVVRRVLVWQRSWTRQRACTSLSWWYSSCMRCLLSATSPRRR